MKKQTKLGLVLAAAAVISVSVASLVSARGWVQNGADWYYVDNNNEYVTDTIQTSGNSKFYLGEDGRMERDYFLEQWGDGENTYYFGQNGAMVTNTWVAIESSRVENQGDYIPDNYWYYFQASGKAMKGNSSRCKRTTIDGKKYAFNEYGQMCTGWFRANGEVINPDEETNPFREAVYYAGGDNDGVLRAGWVTYYDGYDGEGGEENPWVDYDNIYFYFNTSNNRKYGITDEGNGEWVYKKINGRSYAFSDEGIMLSGWDPDHFKTEAGLESLADKRTYFSGQDDGHQVKKGWVYAVPAYGIDSEKYYDDEEVYMYFQSSGDITKDQFKKINGKYYVFSGTGVMKTGVIIWSASGVSGQNRGQHWIAKLDMDYANGSDVTKKGILQTGSTTYLKVTPQGRLLGTLDTSINGTAVVSDGDTNTAYNPAKILSAANALNDAGNHYQEYVKLHNFGSDGARKTGANTVEFSDDNYTLLTNSNGDKGSGAFSKKYYSLGIQLKAAADIRYGIFSIATYADANYDGPNQDTAHEGTKNYAGPFRPQSIGSNNTENWRYNLEHDHYIVLNSSGQKMRGNKAAKKDADGNYWLIDTDTSALKGIWSVNVNGKKTFSKNWETKVITMDGEVDNSNRYASSSRAFRYDELVNQKLAMHVGGPIENSTWYARYSVNETKTKSQIWFVPTTDINLPAYQSDYGDKSNKWIPMGLLDNSNKTVSADQTRVQESSSPAHAYDVMPTNDYFLNCYWSDGANDIMERDGEDGDCWQYVGTIGYPR